MSGVSFDDDGYVIVENFAAGQLVSECRLELSAAVARSLSERPSVFDAGMVHNCFAEGAAMLSVLRSELLRDYTDKLLCPNAIVYAYQASSLPPSKGNFGSRIHCDSPRFFFPHRTNIGFILALDDFTFENGATQVLPGSHKSADTPSAEEFESGCRTLQCAAGDAIFFDARLFHRAGVNRTSAWRHALTINFCRPFMRSRFDFPRLVESLGLEVGDDLSLRKYLGYDVRVPVSLEEFYLPPELRLYKSGQE